MTTRPTSSSLRRRFIWTGAVAAIIALVSAVAIVAYRTAQREVLGSPEGKSTDVSAKPAVGGLPAAKPIRGLPFAQFGYSVRLAGSSWTAWDDLAEVVPEAEFGALLDDKKNGDGRFLVIPVSLSGLEPRPEALDHALLRTWALPVRAIRSAILIRSSVAVPVDIRFKRRGPWRGQRTPTVSKSFGAAAVRT